MIAVSERNRNCLAKIHFQIAEVKGYEEEAMIAFATLLDIEGKTEEAITTLEAINSISSNWQLARVWGL